MGSFTTFLVLWAFTAQVLAKAVNTSSFLAIPNKPRVFILSDISNEPDDAESLTRYLLYANQFHTEGIVATTSTWQRDEVHPEQMLAIINAYANVTENLNRHVSPDSQYPSGKYLRSLLRTGPASYGMTAVGKNVTLSSGGKLLLKSLQAKSDQPLWVLAWGGTNVLAQVLYHIRDTFSATEFTAIRSRLRVYAVSDQDDTGAWIRQQFPDIFYISSTHGWNQYGLAAWIGISGEDYYGVDQGGPDNSTVSHEWLRKNIQVGPYGKEAYPNFKFIMEGDTPTFLYLIQNGLGVSEQPDYGSWGGRYSKVEPSTALNFNHYSDAADRVVGKNNQMFKSSQATIWRWRDAYQNDFAARMQWSLPANLSRPNHHPIISVNGSAELSPLSISAAAGSTLTFNAAATSDPDGDSLTFNWFQYQEPGSSDWNVAGQVPQLNVSSLDGGRKAQVQVPAASESCDAEASTSSGCWLLHVILEVTDDGYHPLTSYRRILIQTTNTTESLS
ncbi:uncharacterized protein N7511_002421 [Penicillium nucicola]|uniref:uncharacterized protein n=1 Tax=Penicillium nucicola TaxID=1850975 RepID=UPI002545B535|nr:uncharacterized protein N7511_002421 [Penicillium nucicola]KAJ5770370.1 hypothetical protein N7511_002421 [Penicillium nucicola]